MLAGNFFNESEFYCKCGRDECPKMVEGGLDPALIVVLNKMRERVGVPITISSGFRCPLHNAESDGRTQSKHMLGCAADIFWKGMDVDEAAALAEECGADGIGKYWTQGFVHVDTRGSFARWDEND